MTKKTSKQKLRVILLQISEILTEKHKDVLCEAGQIKERLNFCLSEKDLPYIVPISCKQKFVDMLKGEALRLYNEELLLMRVIADVKAIAEDVESDSISRSTRSLLFNIHSDLHYQDILKIKKELGSLTGETILLFDKL